MTARRNNLPTGESSIRADGTLPQPAPRLWPVRCRSATLAPTLPATACGRMRIRGRHRRSIGTACQQLWWGCARAKHRRRPNGSAQDTERPALCARRRGMQAECKTSRKLPRPRKTRLRSVCLSRRSGTRIGESCHDANGRVYRHGTHGAVCDFVLDRSAVQTTHTTGGLHGSHDFVFDDSIGGIYGLGQGGEAGVLPPLQLRLCPHGTVKRRLWSWGQDSAARGASDDDRASSRVRQWNEKHQPCCKQGVAVRWLG